MKKEKIILILILGFSLLLRVLFLNKTPPALFGDEIDVGYQAYSLWTTGHDYMGHKQPIYIQSINEWRNALLVYITAPFIGTLGLNEWGVRFPPALLGVLSIFLVYVLTKEISRNNRIALWSAFVCTIIPWHVHYSRAAFDQTLLMCLLLAGTFFFLKEKFIGSALFFGLTLYTYNTANIFVPTIIIFLMFSCKERFKKGYKNILLAGGILALISLPIAWNIFFGEGATRFKSISVFSDSKIVDEIVFKRNTGLTSQTVERVFHNKLWLFGSIFLKNYLSAFSPQFLFLSGDANPRHNVPGFGELFLPMLPFLLVGMFYLLNNSLRVKTKNLILFWLLLAPVPSTLTIDGAGHATRLFLLVFPLVFLVGLGIERVTIANWKKIFTVFLFMFCVIFWWHEYFVHYPKEQAEYWRYGYKEAFLWLKEHESEFDRVFLNNNHDPVLISYCFWTKKHPFWFRQNYLGDKAEKNIISGFDGFKTGNVYLGGISKEAKQSWLIENLDSKTVYLAFQKDEIPGNWDWGKSPPRGIKVLKVVNEPMSNTPYIYLLTADEK